MTCCCSLLYTHCCAFICKYGTEERERVPASTYLVNVKWFPNEELHLFAAAAAAWLHIIQQQQVIHPHHHHTAANKFLLFVH